MTGTIFSALPTLKIDLSDHPFIKYGIFEFNVTLPPMGTHIGVVAHDHHNMSYVSQLTNNIP